MTTYTQIHVDESDDIRTSINSPTDVPVLVIGQKYGTDLRLFLGTNALPVEREEIIDRLIAALTAVRKSLPAAVK